MSKKGKGQEDFLRELEKLIRSPERRERPVAETLSQEYDSIVLEAVGFQAELIDKSPKIRMWRMETEFGNLLLRIEDSHFLKLQAVYGRPDELSPASAVVFANKWNIKRRFTKMAVPAVDDTVMQLEYDADLQHAQVAAVREMIAMFHHAMLAAVLEMHKELKQGQPVF